MQSSRPFLHAIALLLACILGFSEANAQRTALHHSLYAALDQACEVYHSGRYTEARQRFSELQPQFAKTSAEHERCEFLSAMCSFHLFQEDAEYRLSVYGEKYPHGKYLVESKFQLANLYYRNREFKKAIAGYQAITLSDLPPELHPEYQFKLGYSLFTRENYSLAKPLLAEVKDLKNQYAPAASYYYAHICYLEGKYSVALEGFRKFHAKSNFGQVVPYYIIQIYYLQQRYTDAIEYGRRMLDSIPEKRATGIYRILADSYAKTKQFEEAVYYSEKFLKTNPRLERRDWYGFAYVYLQTGQCAKAMPYFRKCITQDSDSLNQLSWYYLAQCELSAGNRKEARNDFGSACKIQIDEEIRENALFNYAKLSYELDQDPFHDAIGSLRNFLNEYSSSDKYEEVFDLLVNALLRSKNYDEALKIISSIKRKTPALEKASAALNCLKATALFNNGKYADCLGFYEKSAAYLSDKKQSASSLFWLAEAAYRLNRTDSAASGYKKFLDAPGAALIKEYHEAYYALGYCYFRKKDYAESSSWFRKYLSLADGEELALWNDACVRVGDEFFADRKFADALDNYAKVKGPAYGDYIAFQRAVIFGLQGKNKEKTEGLLALVNGVKKSPYLDDALYELADCYLIMNENQTALETFKRLMTEFPGSPFVKKSQVKIALIYANTDQDELALDSYKELVTRYPNSPEASQAVASIREIYVNAGKVNEFESFVNSVPALNYSKADIDSATYEAAELKYMKGDCEGATKDLEAYLSKFSAPQFAVNAWYFLADCNNKMKKQAEAQKAYARVSHLPYNNYTDRAVVKAASLAFALQQYDSAWFWYGRMSELLSAPQSQYEALAGKYRCSVKLGKKDDILQFAGRLAENERTTPELLFDCLMNRGKIYLDMQNDTAAISDFTRISEQSKTEKSAEAMYLMASLHFGRGRTEQAVNMLEKIINQDPSYDYWVTRAYLLYADVFEQKGDRFNEKQTLQSIIDNSDNAELVKEAKEKWEAVKAKEKAEEEKRQQEYQEIQFDSNSIRDNDLFEEVR
jgi:tetratricopeptide (TPR) repeat protein